MLAAVAHTLEELRDRDTEYVRKRELGSGAMAITHLGVKRRGAFERRFALKEIREELWANDDFRARFLEEAAIAASLRHSNIVSVIDVNYELGRMVLELVDGVDLWRLVMSTPEQRLRAKDAQHLAVQLCLALRHLHSRRRRGVKSGVVHRDVSPSNVLISYDGDIKLTDFGLATIIKGHEAPYSKVIRGTVPYLSPEQTHAKPLDERSDLFSLSVLLYEALTGERPFDRATDDGTILAIRACDHRHLSEFPDVGPPAFVEFIERNLARDPDKRFSNADACLDWLKQLSIPQRNREFGALVHRARKPETVDDSVPERQPKRRPSRGRAVPATRWLAMAGGLAVLGVAGLSVATTLSRPTTTLTPITQTPVHEPEKVSEPAFQQAHLTSTAPPAAPEMGSAEPVPTEVAPPVPAASAPPPTAEPSSEAAASPQAAKLKVMTEPLPLGLVWIDGRAKGRAPVELSLRPGKHTIGAGRTAPDHTSTLRLRAGEARTVTVDLGPAVEVE
jgi:serine/threonine-protein kinase